MKKTNVLISGATGWLGREILNIFSETKFKAVKLSLISSKSQDFIVGDNEFKARSFVSYSNSDSIDNYFDFRKLRKRINCSNCMSVLEYLSHSDKVLAHGCAGE